jgi:hypothetical protein
MTPEQQLDNLTYELGAALQRRAALKAKHHDDPSAATFEWLIEARRDVKNVQARTRRLEAIRYRAYSEPARS